MLVFWRCLNPYWRLCMGLPKSKWGLPFGSCSRCSRCLQACSEGQPQRLPRRSHVRFLRYNPAIMVIIFNYTCISQMKLTDKSYGLLPTWLACWFCPSAVSSIHKTIHINFNWNGPFPRHAKTQIEQSCRQSLAEPCGLPRARQHIHTQAHTNSYTVWQFMWIQCDSVWECVRFSVTVFASKHSVKVYIDSVWNWLKPVHAPPQPLLQIPHATCLK